MNKLSTFGAILIGLLVGGCGLTDPRRGTPAVTFVTATPAPVTADGSAPIAVLNTPVLAEAITATPFVPDLPTATRTGQPTSRPTLTPSFTVTYTESPEPTQRVQKCNATPQGGFATIYGKDPGLQRSLGCAIGNAAPITAANQDFESGRMIYASQLGEQPIRVIYVLYNNGSFQRYDDTWIENVDPANTGANPPPGRLAPIRGFGKVWNNNPAVRSGLGWATNTEQGAPAQSQRFERGEMVFLSSLKQTFILVGGQPWRVDSTPF